MRHPRRDHGDVAGAHCAHLTVQLELELTLQHDGELLLHVDVHRSLRPRFERHEVDQRPVAEDGSECQAGDELDRFDVSRRQRTGPVRSGVPPASVLKCWTVSVMASPMLI